MANTLKYGSILISILILCLLNAEPIISQPKTIKGIVLEEDTGEPIPGAHVYITQTTLGTTTEDNGTFEISTDLTGIQKIVFSFIGYKTMTADVNLNSSKSVFTFEVEMAIDDFVLGPLEVTASNKEWKQNFSRFRRFFIGRTAAARETEIENSWAISFEEDDDGNLIARASEPLTVTNRALGYEIRVDLVEFKLNLHDDTGHYFFYSRFKELEPRSNREMKRWLRNRRETYRGSFQHFLQSLYTDRLKENRFESVLPDSDNPIEISRLDSISSRRLHLYTSVSFINERNVKAYRLNSPVDVLYGYRWRWSRNHRQRSRLVPMRESGIFLVTKEARLLNPASLRLDGAWSHERVADFLPANYSAMNNSTVQSN